MKPLENVWTGLVQRRLLPVAILLLAAIVAIPFLLAKDPEPVAPAPVAPSAATGTKDEIAKPVVSLTDENAPATRRRVLGAVKDPFTPGKAPKSAATPTPAAAGASGTGATTGTTGATGGATSGGSVAGAGATSPSASAPAPSAPVAQSTPEPVAQAPASSERDDNYTVYSAVVRFGTPGGESKQQTLKRLTPLPDAKSPAVVYLGVGRDDNGAKAAYFLVGDTVELEDETQCRPSQRDCQGVILKVGKTAALRSVDEQTGEVTGRYEIEVVKIKREVVSGSDKAAKARAEESKAGRRALRAHQATYGPLRYRYDAKSGLVRKIDKRAYKALLAKTARAAIGTAGGF